MLLAAASGRAMAADVASLGTDPRQLNLKVGSCNLELYASANWTKDGTKFKSTAKDATLRVAGQSTGMPIRSPLPLVVDNAKFSLSLTDLIPLPGGDLFKVLKPALGVIPNVSMGIDTGANIEAKAPDLMLQDDKTYLYFLSDFGFSIDLNKKDTSSPNPAQGKAKSVGLQPIFALDPCDPAILLGGASVTVELVTVDVAALGFSLKNALDFATGTQFWRGKNTSGGPVYEAFTMGANAYLKGSVNVGVGKYAAVGFDGLVGLALTPLTDVVTQALRLVTKGELPTGSFKLAIEGEKTVTLLDTIKIPYEGGAGALDVSRSGNQTNVELLVMGKKGPKLSLDDLIGGFGVKVPGVDSLEAGGDVEVHTYAKAAMTGTFANPTLIPSGTEFGVLLKGDLYAAGQKLEGSVQLKYKESSKKFSACLQIPFVDSLQCGDACIKDSDCSVAGQACVFGICANKMPDGAPCYSNTQCSSGKCMVVCGATAATYATAAGEVKGFFDQLGSAIEGAFVQLGKDIATAATAVGAWGTHQLEHAIKDPSKCSGEADGLGRVAGSGLWEHAEGELPRLLAAAAQRTERVPAPARMWVTRGAIKSFVDKYNGKVLESAGPARDEVQHWRTLVADQIALKAKVDAGAQAAFQGFPERAYMAWHRAFNGAHFGGEIELRAKSAAGSRVFIATPTSDGAYWLTDKLTGEFFAANDAPFVFEWEPASRAYLIRPFRGGVDRHFGNDGKLTDVINDMSRFVVKAIAHSGDYELHAPTGKVKWATDADAGFGVRSATGNGPRVRFTIVPQADDGTVLIQSKETGRYVSVRSDGLLETVKDGRGPRARFQLEPLPSGAHRIWSHALGTVVYVDGQQRLATRRALPGANQDGEGFILSRPDVAPALAKWTHATLLNVKSSLCAGAGDRPGTPVKAEFCSDTTGRRWTARNTGGGVYQIVDDQSRLCLGVSGVDNHKSGAPAELFSCEPSPSDPKLDQRWRILGPADSAAPRLQNLVSGLCLDLPGPASQYQPVGTGLVVSACGPEGESDQYWRTKGRLDRVTSVVVGEGFWGKWREAKFCPDGTWAHGFAIRVEADQGSNNDDTALNSVRLLCGDTARSTETVVSSHNGWWGDWGANTSCNRGAYLDGARMKVERKQLGNDDTAANDVAFACSDGSERASSGGRPWGEWSPTARCPAYTHVCGLSIRLEDKQDGDDSAMNGLELHCCAGPARTTGGRRTSVYEIQQGKVAPNTAVVVEGLVAASGLITAKGRSGFFAMDPDGGEYSGVWVFVDTHAVTVTPGDVLTIAGTYGEFYNNSQLTIASPDDLVKTGTATTPTFPVVAAAELATGSARAENFEGMCVKVLGAKVTAAVDQYGDLVVEGGLKINNRASGAAPAVGQTYSSITGCMEYAFNASKLVPRKPGDLVQ